MWYNSWFTPLCDSCDLCIASSQMFFGCLSPLSLETAECNWQCVIKQMLSSVLNIYDTTLFHVRSVTSIIDPISKFFVTKQRENPNTALLNEQQIRHCCFGTGHHRFSMLRSGYSLFIILCQHTWKGTSYLAYKMLVSASVWHSEIVL